MCLCTYPVSKYVDINSPLILSKFSDKISGRFSFFLKAFVWLCFFFHRSLWYFWKMIIITNVLVFHFMYFQKQKCAKISGRKFVLNLDFSYESAIYIKNSLLHCYIFWFYFPVIIYHLQKNGFIYFDKNVHVLRHSFLRINFNTMNIYIYILEFFTVVFNRWSRYLISL